MIRDAEATVYAIEAAICLISSLSEGNWAQAAMDAISLAGWVRNAI